MATGHGFGRMASFAWRGTTCRAPTGQKPRGGTRATAMRVARVTPQKRDDRGCFHVEKPPGTYLYDSGSHGAWEFQLGCGLELAFCSWDFSFAAPASIGFPAESSSRSTNRFRSIMATTFLRNSKSMFQSTTSLTLCLRIGWARLAHPARLSLPFSQSGRSRGTEPLFSDLPTGTSGDEDYLKDCLWVCS